MTANKSNPSRWSSSQRRPDPPHWKAIRQLVAERDGHRCQEVMRDGTQCTDVGTECDHIINLANGGTDDLENLRMLCKWHHGKKSSREGAQARVPLRETRPKETHPGFH